MRIILVAAATLVALAGTAGLPAGTQPAGAGGPRAAGSAPPPATPVNEAEELRKAIALVLTGDEAGPVSFVNRAECTVQLPDALNTLQITIYLNRVILARSRILDRRVSDPDEPEPGITVILRGDKVVHFPGAAATKVGEVEVPAAPESHWSEFRVRLHTQDYPRIRSAWDYIYSHGCRGR